MAIRKVQRWGWSLRIHGKKHVGAAALAVRTRGSIEAPHCEGKDSLLAFLDCSKCYERVKHALVGERALDTGLGGRLANMSFDLHKWPRHTEVHGVVTHSEFGNSGLVAGCVVAKYIPNSFLGAFKWECAETRPRDVGDTALQVAQTRRICTPSA